MKAVGGSGGTERGWEGWLSMGIKIKDPATFTDVTVTDWATLEMSPAGLTSVKSATLIKNVTIFVAKRTKN